MPWFRQSLGRKAVVHRPSLSMESMLQTLLQTGRSEFDGTEIVLWSLFVLTIKSFDAKYLNFFFLPRV